MTPAIPRARQCLRQAVRQGRFLSHQTVSGHRSRALTVRLEWVVIFPLPLRNWLIIHGTSDHLQVAIIRLPQVSNHLLCLGHPFRVIFPLVLEILPSESWVHRQSHVIDGGLIQPAVVLIELFPTQIQIDSEVLRVGHPRRKLLIVFQDFQQELESLDHFPYIPVRADPPSLQLALLAVAFQRLDSILVESQKLGQVLEDIPGIGRKLVFLQANPGLLS
jgi:hypothetical protein